ncbi:methionine ABC transporter ATP-binding protein [Periweissella beninensis]|uniref:ATP-binding cassette domain-containing protein n=1 Tax=Periweissella beninensis TaxID=504936 RepID=A0ABT0VG13_9LACO|nr:ATP-binding cassette domain-containing protein [Periweissella beninensis]MBM7545023.1 D-methionine transport system ATP-binding protein [Periweissella beninensis]MCM2436354.1 ATP-binding cassette domain-containing protein [Periweissella beninensis]MCT4395881.1 ATP-binding cassette domain-containing protein [Periweissella beninensis]
MSEQSIISLKNIEVKFQQKNQLIHAVKDVSLDIERGDIYGIVGYSGAGKSTLVRVINLLQKPTSGTVLVNNIPLAETNNNKTTYLQGSKLRNARKKIGMIFQHFNLMNERTVADNVLFPIARNHTLTKEQKNTKVADLLALVGLSDRSNAYPSQLSGGQKQRVAIARALASDPEILISDEATSALDPKTTNAILALLKSLNEKLGLTIVLITHEMQAVKDIANKVAVMENGQIIENGSLLEIFTNPQKQLTKDFIDTATQLEDGLAKVQAQPIVTNLQAPDVLVQFSYAGETTGEPLISSLFKEYGIVANILFGNVEILQSTPVGTLIVILSGESHAIQTALHNVKEQGVKVTLLKGELI